MTVAASNHLLASSSKDPLEANKQSSRRVPVTIQRESGGKGKGARKGTVDGLEAFNAGVVRCREEPEAFIRRVDLEHCPASRLLKVDRRGKRFEHPRNCQLRRGDP
jgi:hypothetical protein